MTSPTECAWHHRDYRCTFSAKLNLQVRCHSSTNTSGSNLKFCISKKLSMKVIKIAIVHFLNYFKHVL